jgi:hypothetical protein
MARLLTKPRHRAERGQVIRPSSWRASALPSDSETFGVLPAKTKNSLSHRARALASMKAWMETNL